jgi:hypothetical protein
MQNYLQWGSWNTICDSCGLKFKSEELRRRWDGLMVCSKDYEQRHPQDLIRSKAERSTVAYARPEAEDTFLHICYIWERAAYADLGTADCMEADNTSLPYPLLYSLSLGI